MDQDIVTSTPVGLRAEKPNKRPHLSDSLDMSQSIEQKVDIIQSNMVTKQDLKDIVQDLISAMVQPLTEKLHQLEAENTLLKDRMTQIEENNQLALNELEQYSRRNCVRIHGLHEVENEDTDKIVLGVAKEMGITLDINSIERSHRIGPKPLASKVAAKEKSSRSIIVRFVSYRDRLLFIQNRKKLKATKLGKVFINEDLTAANARLAAKARILVKENKLESTWTRDGKVFIRKKDGVVHRIKADGDLRL